MTCQRRGVAETFSTPGELALMGTLARMDTRVDRQGGALDEALSTAGEIARVGSLARVDALVAGKIGATAKGLAAVRTLVKLGATGIALGVFAQGGSGSSGGLSCL